MNITPLLLVAILLFPVYRASGYELVMKDGKKIEGTLIVQRESVIILKNTAGVLLNFNKSDVDLEKTSEANKTEVKPTPAAAFENNKVERQQPVRKSGRVLSKDDLEELRKKYDLGQGSFGAAEKVSYTAKEREQKADLENHPDFRKEVLDSPVPVLVDFWASWCGPCRQVAPRVDEVESDFEGKAKVYRVNIDSERELSKFYEVEAIPTLLFFKNGEIAQRIVGAVQKDKIAQTLQQLID